MPDYSNIYNALRHEGQTPETPRKLTTAQELDNYAAFSDMMQKGIYLPDLMKKIDDLSKRIDEMDGRPAVDEDLFEAMEAAVSDDADVKSAYGRVCDAKTEALKRICLADPDFKTAYDEYRRVVHRAYVAKKDA